MGNANNDPSEDSVTKIQKAAPCVKPRLDSPLHWTQKYQNWGYMTEYTAQIYATYFSLHPDPLISFVCMDGFVHHLLCVFLGGKLHQVGLDKLSEPLDGIRAPLCLASFFAHFDDVLKFP